jgi:hypothetical protein
MSELTYYVALPFLAGDDGVAAGEPTECFNPDAAVMRAEALHAKKATSALSPSVHGRPCYSRFQRRQGHQEIWRRARSKRVVTGETRWQILRTT